MKFYLSALALAVMCTLGVRPSTAATHFEGCAFNTGGNATVVIPVTASVDVDGVPLSVGDELAVYSAEGVCAGSAVWSGETLAFAVWGDNIVTPTYDGFVTGETMHFRAWLASDGVEVSGVTELIYSADKPHYDTHGEYVENGIFVLESLKLTRMQTGEELRKTVSTERFVPGDLPVTLAQNFPNPFNPSTTISYALTQPSAVRLSVMNVLGQPVRVLVDGQQPAGEHTVQVDMHGLPSGMYLYRIETAGAVLTRTMLLAK